MTTRPRGKPQAYLDSDGYVYQTGKGGGLAGFITTIATCLLFLILGALGVMNYLHIPYDALTQPLPTAGVPTRTALSPPRDPPQTFGGASAPAEQAPAAVEPTRAWPDDGGADLQVAPVAPEPAPAADNEAAIEAWLAAPPSTPTPLPEPGQPGFAASFEEAPACSPFVGYVGPDKVRCDAVFLEQTAVAAGE